MKKYIVIISIFLSFSVLLSQNSKRISGQIFDENDKPIPNSFVSLYGSYHFAYTDPKSGRFILNLSEDSEYFSANAFGYVSQKIKIDNNVKIYNIKLKKKEFVVDKNNKIDKELGEGEIGGSLYETHDRYTLKEDISSEKSIKVSGKGASTKSKIIASMSRTASEGGDGIDLGGFASSIELASPDRRGLPEPAGNPIERSGLLTAGEVNDFTKWRMWNDIIEQDLAQYKDLWKIYPTQRYTLQIDNEFQNPVFGVKINLLENGYVIWSSVTDNTGKAELWANTYINRKSVSKNLSLEIEFKNNYYYIDKPKNFTEGINFYTLQTGCIKPKFVDIAFLVDATGSMGDEINYLKMDIKAIIEKIQDTLPNMKFHTGVAFYRDTTDEYLTKFKDFNSDINIIKEFISENEAAGGGDFPEAVHRGLDVVINQMSWREDAIAKVIFLILDAPPHTKPEILNELQALTLKASEKGIRIIPVTCSGIDKSTEFLLRSIALLTNGTYTFLTDDSGIGNPHIKPSTDKYEVETLNELLIRLVFQYSYYPECKTIYPELVEEISDVKLPETGNNDTEDSETIKNFKIYPNPTFGNITIELDGNAEEFFIADISGKVIMRIESKGLKVVNLDLSSYTSGTYSLMYQYKPDKWIKGKIVLVH